MSYGDPDDWRVWLEKAANDLLNIDNNLRSTAVPWDTICFHAQQAAEKSMKGFLTWYSRVFRKTHNLTELGTMCASIDATLEPGLELWLDRLHFLVWANTYDARAGEPVWWWSRKAARLGAAEPTAEAAERLVRERQPHYFSYADWQQIDDLETTRGTELGRPRVKYTCTEDMLDALGRA